LDEALVGNVFSIDMKMTDRKVEMEIMKTIFLKNKEADERIRCLIKIEKSNNKLSNRILIIKEEEKGLIGKIQDTFFFYCLRNVDGMHHKNERR